MSNNLFKTLGFSIGMILLFTLVANLLPQVEGEAPEEVEMNMGSLTNESFAAMGESLFNGKGTCTLCHNAMGRAPDIKAANMVETAKTRLADARYKGTATTPEEYIRESMLHPGAYVVASYGKKGSNDTESPMPTIDKAPIGLSPAEIDAIIAYLEVKDGNEMTVALPTEAPAAPAADAAAPAAPAATAEAVAAKYGCQACHTLMGTESPVGPKLTDVGSRLKPEQIRRSIVEPNADIANGFSADIMPGDFATKMTVSELDLLVNFLSKQK